MDNKMIPFNPTNKEQRPLMTPDGRGWLMSRSVNSNNGEIEYLVKLSAEPIKCLLYKAEELQEIEVVP